MNWFKKLIYKIRVKMTFCFTQADWNDFKRCGCCSIVPLEIEQPIETVKKYQTFEGNNIRFYRTKGNHVEEE